MQVDEIGLRDTFTYDLDGRREDASHSRHRAPSAAQRRLSSASGAHPPGTHVAVKRRGTRSYNHPVVGEIKLEWDALTSEAEPDQQLIVYTPEPGSRSEEALRELAAWAAEHIETPR